MQFDRFTVSLLTLRPDAPPLSDEALDTLQDEHLAHLSALHDAGVLLAAGPLPGPDDRHFRGLSIWAPQPDEVRELIDEHPDPAVAAGRFSVTVLTWLVPSGAIQFSRTQLPRSIAEATGV